jgi:hypothetical protein
MHTCVLLTKTTAPGTPEEITEYACCYRYNSTHHWEDAEGGLCFTPWVDVDAAGWQAAADRYQAQFQAQAQAVARVAAVIEVVEKELPNEPRGRTWEPTLYAVLPMSVAAPTRPRQRPSSYG